MKKNIHIAEDLEANSKAAAAFLINTGEKAIAERGKFIVSLAGGSTPKRMYELLAGAEFKEALDWSKVIVIWGDERCVPETSSDSNSRMAKEAWLNQVPIPAAQIYPVNGTLHPAQAARGYEAQLKKVLGAKLDAIDLCLLGLGDDGHTASLFPHTDVLKEKERWVSEVYVEKFDSWRVTLTAPVIRNSKQIAFLVSGAKKAAILPKVLEGPFQPEDYPSQLIIQDNAAVHWFLDKAAANK